MMNTERVLTGVPGLLSLQKKQYHQERTGLSQDKTVGETFKEEIKDIANFANVKLERKKKKLWMVGG